MSSDSWDTSAQQERIKHRKRKLHEKQQERAEKNPEAFGWDKTDDGMYQCNECEKTYRKLPGCIRHIKNVHASKREDGQSSLGEW